MTYTRASLTARQILRRELGLCTVYSPTARRFVVESYAGAIANVDNFAQADATINAHLDTVAEARATLAALMNGIHPDPESGQLVAWHQGQLVATGAQTDYRDLLVALSDVRIRALRIADTVANAPTLPTYDQLKAAEREGSLSAALAALTSDQLETVTQDYIAERRTRHGVSLSFQTTYHRFQELAQQRQAA